MRTTRIGDRRDPVARQEGRGTLGCLFSLALLGATAYFVAQAGPPYFAHKSLEADLRAGISQAGAHAYDNARVLSMVLDTAKRNEIQLTQENVKIDRFGSQLQVAVAYAVPVDLLIVQREFIFEIKLQTFVGRL